MVKKVEIVEFKLDFNIEQEILALTESMSKEMDSNAKATIEAARAKDALKRASDDAKKLEQVKWNKMIGETFLRLKVSKASKSEMASSLGVGDKIFNSVMLRLGNLIKKKFENEYLLKRTREKGETWYALVSINPQKTD